MSFQKAVLSLVLGGALTACATTPIDEFFDTSNDFASEACACHMEFGFESEAVCRDNFDFDIAESAKACVRDAYTANEAEAEPTVTCLTTVFARGADCAKSAECDAMAFQTCIEDLMRSECPSLPRAIEDEFDRCEE